MIIIEVLELRMKQTRPLGLEVRAVNIREGAESQANHSTPERIFEQRSCFSHKIQWRLL